MEIIEKVILCFTSRITILAVSWFAPAENMGFIEKKGKTFIFEINDNRLAATGKQEREKGYFIRIDRMEMPDE